MSLLTRSAANRKLNEITGGLVFSEEFKNTLSLNGLDLLDGYRIYNQIKEDIKNDKVQEEDVPNSVQSLINQLKEEKDISQDSISNQDSNIKRPDYYGHHEEDSDNSQDDEKTAMSQDDDKPESLNVAQESEDKKQYDTAEFEFNPEDMDKWVEENKVKELEFLLNQQHNIRPCPKCGAIILLKDKFCYKCGCEVLKVADVPKETNIGEKKTQNENIAFKFAYVLYLDQINKKPDKKIANDTYFKDYNVKVSKLKKQANEDGYLEKGNPLAAAKKRTVKDLRAILKEHGLYVSGKKDELIERLSENLTDEELKKEFPSKLISVNEEGIKFIEENRYVFYYNKNAILREMVSVEEYDSIFANVNDLTDKNILKCVEEHLLQKEDILVRNAQWKEYIFNLYLLSSVYEDLKDGNKLLDSFFKIFIIAINTPGHGFIDEISSANIIHMLNALRLGEDEIKNAFDKAYDDIKLPALAISKEESFAYLLKVLNGDDITALTEEIRSKYK